MRGSGVEARVGLGSREEMGMEERLRGFGMAEVKGELRDG